jgi:hypothetical protein
VPGPVELLTKPYQPQWLLERLKEIEAGQRARAELPPPYLPEYVE